MPRWLQRYGDPFLIRSFNGDVVVCTDAELIKAIFKGRPDGYEAFGGDAVRPLTGDASVLVTQGRTHTRQRKLLMPPFHGERMRAYAQIMLERARDEFEEVLGARTSFVHLAERISLRVIIRAVFGVSSEAREQEFSDAILEFSSSFHPTFSFMSFVQRGWFPPWRRFVRTRARFEALMDEEIERARAEAGREDILTLLVEAVDEEGEGMGDAEIKSQLLTLLFAGYETTALTLAWAVDEFYRRPTVLGRIREEVDALEDPNDGLGYTQLPYLDAAIKETLRLHPVITEVLRLLDADMTLGDRTLPRGMAVSASILLAHLDPGRYDDPTAFHPDRFLERKYGPFDFLPFGGGHRRCIGAAFSTFEMQISLGMLLRDYDVTLHDTALPAAVRKNLVMGPDSEVPVTIQRRAG